MATKKKKVVQFTLRGVRLSYPVLKTPQEFKKNEYFKTDALMEMDDPQAAKLRKLILGVKVAKWGEDKSEWPEGHVHASVKKGDTREDQKEYKGKYFITATKNAENGQPPVVDQRGKPFKGNIHGGMIADVAVTIGVWKDGEGASIWLDAVMIDPTNEDHKNFGGGGGDVKKRFGIESSEDDDDGDEDDDDDDDDQPHKSKKGKKAKKGFSFGDDDDDGDNDADEEE